jgi:HK97 family phage prohead protease
MELKRIVRPLEIKSIDETTGIFSGYGSVFGNVDSYNEVVLQGAFSKSLSEKTPNKIKLLWQHKSDDEIGVYNQVREDDYGLFVEGQLAIKDVQQAKEAYALLKMGALDGLSIGYSVNEGGQKAKDGVVYLSDINLWEISVVTFPANTAANITQVKTNSIDNIRDFEKHLRDVGFSVSQAKRIASHGFKAIDSHREVDSEEAEALLASINKLHQSLIT